jgi:hypothetical protein
MQALQQRAPNPEFSKANEKRWQQRRRATKQSMIEQIAHKEEMKRMEKVKTRAPA